MRETFASNLYVAGSLIGFSVGLVIAFLLLVLAHRASRLPGTPSANLQCALCALLWNFGGVAHTIACALGWRPGSLPALFSSALQFSGAAVWPLPMLSIWRPLARVHGQKAGLRALEIIARISACAMIVALWLLPFVGVSNRQALTLKELTSFNGTIVLVGGAVLLLRGRMSSRVTRFASSTIVVGVLASSVGIAIQETFHFSGNVGGALAVVSEQATLLIVFGAFFLFARFRFADLFIRYSVGIVMASALAVLLVLVSGSSTLGYMANLTKFPPAIQFFARGVLAAVFLLSFAFLERRSAALVNRWLFEAPDYRQAARHLDDTLAQLYEDSAIASATEHSVRTTLELEDVRVVRLQAGWCAAWPSELRNGELFELEGASPLGAELSMPHLELLIPVRSSGQVTHVLAVAPGPIRRGLISEEINYLRTVAAQLGGRFDSLRVERETIEQGSREARLLQQVTEAELRALRAQVNPHFLFNSLNTIANLIEANPPAAETMTLRLARVFRYVLAHSAHPTTSIHEEIEFLRTYLEIEEARFGDRLKVQIDIAPDAASEHIPSLILQPIVENALKHGLAPKLGPGYLWISAHLAGDRVCLKVEDDGVGSRWPRERSHHEKRPDPLSENCRIPVLGVGLRNIAERLETFYHKRAHLNFEGRESGGTRVTLWLPRSNGVLGP